MSSKPATIEDLCKENYPIFLKHPQEYLLIKITEMTIFTVRVVLLDEGYSFEHKRKKKTYKCENDFGEALDKLVGFNLITEYDYMVALRDYFHKEHEARERFRPVYEQFLTQYRMNN
ncbi:hypothetical protein [Roseivirga thermotolerans]|uniref:Uncharacterized protein n=1 Tax=Roseivirga thermotolerans TaxID=1758176 RepID=A0ABQ3I9B0_9BACT|nr:hypothetical protein [Roseivirga thermotolerans]GHE65180.1 hypothetical protein GCM10011340_20320 [Roseivirga thermotolerans]